MSASDEVFRASGTLGCENPGQVVLESRLRAAWERLNPALPPEAITAAVDELTRDRSAMLLEQANRRFIFCSRRHHFFESLFHLTRQPFCGPILGTTLGPHFVIV